LIAKVREASAGQEAVSILKYAHTILSTSSFPERGERKFAFAYRLPPQKIIKRKHTRLQSLPIAPGVRFCVALQPQRVPRNNRPSKKEKEKQPNKRSCKGFAK
jgi:hypothetical protein